MTEEELKGIVAKLADHLARAAARDGDPIDNVEFVQEDGPLEGEPASITLNFDGTDLVLGVLPL